MCYSSGCGQALIFWWHRCPFLQKPPLQESHFSVLLLSLPFFWRNISFNFFNAYIWVLGVVFLYGRYRGSVFSARPPDAARRHGLLSSAAAFFTLIIQSSSHCSTFGVWRTETIPDSALVGPLPRPQDSFSANAKITHLKNKNSSPAHFLTIPHLPL